MARNAVTSAAITDALIFMALAMLLTRTVGMTTRAFTLDDANPVDVHSHCAPAVDAIA
jgi:hypothetical protein